MTLLKRSLKKIDVKDLEDECAHTILYSKDKSILPSTEVSNISGSVEAENIVTNRIGITKYAASRIKTTRDSF